MIIHDLDRYDLINSPLSDKPAFTIWFAGCPFRCRGCHNEALQNANNGAIYGVDDIVDKIIKASETIEYEYVVLLGGEPLAQPEHELRELCTKITDMGYKIWLYTGYRYWDIPTSITKHCDIIKCGQFIEEFKQDGFPATSNQVVLKNLGFGFENVTAKYREVKLNENKYVAQTRI